MKKRYKKSTKALVKEAFKLADELKAQGWTKKDFVDSLIAMLDSPNGESNLPKKNP